MLWSIQERPIANHKQEPVAKSALDELLAGRRLRRETDARMTHGLKKRSQTKRGRSAAVTGRRFTARHLLALADHPTPTLGTCSDTYFSEAHILLPCPESPKTTPSNAPGYLCDYPSTSTTNATLYPTVDNHHSAVAAQRLNRNNESSPNRETRILRRNLAS